MNKHSLRKLPLITLSLATLVSFGFSGAVAASGFAAPSTDAKETAIKVAGYRNSGDIAISSRLTSLNALQTKINGLTKLTTGDKAELTTEVSSDVSGLTALKTKLDKDSTVASAQADDNQIYGGYRVYMLMVPKVKIIALADQELTTDTDLNFALPFLQAGADAANNSKAKSQLVDMGAKIVAAEKIAQPYETKVLALKPTDYNSDHSLLSGDLTNLKTAQADNKAAVVDAKAVIAELGWNQPASTSTDPANQ